MNSKSHLLGVAVVVVAIGSGVPLRASAIDVRFNVFADVSLGVLLGDPSTASDAAKEDMFGLGAFPLNVNEGFAIVGSDFVLTADLTDNLVYQAEVNLQVGRTEQSEIEVDFERMYLDYRWSDLINIQGGLYFTPIGYHNRFLYSRAWLTYSIQVHELFEEELNLMPTHTVGINVHGSFERGDHLFKYAIGIGNSRKSTPVEVAYARFAALTEGDLEFTALIEWHAPIEDPLIVGISGWTSKIRTEKVPKGLGMESVGEAAKLREYGIDGYVTYFGQDFNVLFEGVWGRVHDSLGNLPKKNSDTGGITIEVSGNMKQNTVHPYIRYDRTWLPGSTDPFYALRTDGTDDALFRHFISDFNAGIVGVAYDWNANARLKFEVIKHFTGSRRDWGIAAQVAFGF